MRAVLSLGALLLVVFLVSKMAGTQLQALNPSAGGEAQTGPVVSPAEAAADKMRKALDQGAAAAAAAVEKAEDAASR
ncbi:MAG: hypothetical protein Q8R98_18850 [Rubrivivax sp.]|nr:hypothetical protein [Rubrivivax sp.]MDP3225219.1 hypothetical protein [Rubrivivax sp.]MDP3613904.1 hypothetical protein [Rubrivivax sp.]